MGLAIVNRRRGRPTKAEVFQQNPAFRAGTILFRILEDSTKTLILHSNQDESYFSATLATDDKKEHVNAVRDSLIDALLNVVGEEDSKTCTACQQMKPLKCFKKAPGSRGLQRYRSQCRECTRRASQ